MEEFDKPSNAAGSDDVILPAEKKVTLQPIHQTIDVDEQNDAQIAASHATGAPIGNFSDDREVTGGDDTDETYKMPNTSSKFNKATQKPVDMTKRHSSTISIVALLIVIGILFFAIVYR